LLKQETTTNTLINSSSSRLRYLKHLGTVSYLFIILFYFLLFFIFYFLFWINELFSTGFEEEIDCGICKGEVVEGILTECGHSFCEAW